MAFSRRTLARFTLVADKVHALDLNSAKVRRFIGLLKERDIVIDPTTAIFERRAGVAAGPRCGPPGP